MPHTTTNSLTYVHYVSVQIGYCFTVSHIFMISCCNLRCYCLYIITNVYVCINRHGVIQYMMKKAIGLGIEIMHMCIMYVRMYIETIITCGKRVSLRPSQWRERKEWINGCGSCSGTAIVSKSAYNMCRNMAHLLGR